MLLLCVLYLSHPGSERKKKAISEADIKADINKRNNANTKATTGPVARVCIPISLKNSDKK